jgi:transcriptional regulator with XRE-family HTH domain
MIRFNTDFLETFLAVVRKYMQLRGSLTQKDLAEQTDINISTMSRFLNLKTSNVDEQLVAKIIATLNIPLHEIIDGIEEESTDTFKGLVQFYKEHRPVEEKNSPNGGVAPEIKKTNPTINIGGRKQQIPFGEPARPERNRQELTMKEKIETLSPRQRAYLNDFLNLDVNDRDLIVDLGDAIFRYFRQRSLEF